VTFRWLLRVQATCLLFLAVASSIQRAEAQSDSVVFQKGRWTGMVMATGSTFHGCLAKTDFQTGLDPGITFALAQLGNRQWVAGFTKPGGFKPNLRWDMELLVDGASVHRGTAVVGTEGLAILQPPLPSSAINFLSTGHKLEVVTVRGRFEYSLAGSGDAIALTDRCVSHFSKVAATGAKLAPPSRADAGGVSSGSGFFVTGEGHVLTNAHVVENCQAVSVTRPGEPPQGAGVIARDRTNDLALLLTTLKPTATVPPLRLGVRTGESVAVFGFPLAGLLPSTGNFTVGNVTATAGLRDDTRILQVSAPVQPGNSGGPLLDQEGNIAGVVVAKMDAIATAAATADIPQNVNFAIKATVAATFLETNGVSVRSVVPGGGALTPADIADRAKLITVFVACR
jgi:serine protease Do